jgi:hypothetical protein
VRTDFAKLRHRSENAQNNLRLVLQRAWPLDRSSTFNGLIRAIDTFDRGQNRQRKHCRRKDVFSNNGEAQ